MIIMAKKDDLRPLTKEELGNNPLLLKRIAEWDFSPDLKGMFYLMFGHRWERYCLVKEFIEKFVRVDKNGNQVLKAEGLIWKGYGRTTTPMSQMLYTLLPPYIPEIREKLNELPFIDIK